MVPKPENSVTDAPKNPTPNGSKPQVSVNATPTTFKSRTNAPQEIKLLVKKIPRNALLVLSSMPTTECVLPAQSAASAAQTATLATFVYHNSAITVTPKPVLNCAAMVEDSPWNVMMATTKMVMVAQEIVRLRKDINAQVAHLLTTMNADSIDPLRLNS